VVDHYADEYWNALWPVVDYLQRRSTGDPKLWWMDYLRDRYNPAGFERALVIGCGNGWVERDLFDRGVAKRFDAFDASEAYLSEAERARGDRPIHYFEADFRQLQLRDRYDLVVNVAALHHAQYLYGATRVLAHALVPDGLFVHWEYVGPSRNQYPRGQVRAMGEVRDSLPERFRTPHALRHDLRDMVLGDPTEAVHSSEIRRALLDYLDIVEWRDLGGGIAYQLLWNHLAPFRDGSPEAEAALERILAADAALSGTAGVPHLFAFAVMQRRRGADTIGATVRRLVREPVREAVAQRSGGYYPVELLRLWLAGHPRISRPLRFGRHLAAGRRS
jgi:SAM-dependent methyltransferase